MKSRIHPPNNIKTFQKVEVEKGYAYDKFRETQKASNGTKIENGDELPWGVPIANNNEFNKRRIGVKNDDFGGVSSTKISSITP
jgi:hypothetical protein